MRNIIIFLCFIFLIAGACTKEVNVIDSQDAISIAEEMNYNPLGSLYAAFTFRQGERIVIPSKYTINDPTLNEKDLTFEWILGDEVVSTDETLDIDPMPVDRYNGILIITEHRYGMKYSSLFNFEVEPDITAGWAVLTDDGLDAHLNYLYIDVNTGEYVLKEDVYATQNPGEPLESGAGPLIYHPYSPTEYGLTVIQSGKDGPVDLNAHDMSVYGKIKDNFVAGVPSTDFSDIAWKLNLYSVCALNENGQLYVRDEASFENAGLPTVVPFSGKFSGPLVMSEGQYSVSHMINTSLLSSMMVSTELVICYDELNSRCMYVRGTQATPFSDALFVNGEDERYMPGDAGWDGTSRVEEEFPSPSDLSEYNVLKMIACGYSAGEVVMCMPPYIPYPGITVVMILEKKAVPGEYYLFVYDLYDLDIDLSRFCKWPSDIPIDPETMIVHNMLGASPRYYFTSEGNMDLYYMDVPFDGPTKYGKVYSSDIEITAFGKGPVSNAEYDGFGFGAPSIYQDQVLVGDSEGGIKVIGIDKVTLKSEVKATFASNTGKVTYAEFMPNNSSDY